MKGRNLFLFLLVLSLGFVSSCKKEQGQEEDPYLGEGEISDELPVSRVALYQNGVGYFERSGQVNGEIITLRIRPDQINDILKSLTVIDLGDGRPVSISLPVDKQAVDELAAIPEQIRQDGGVLSLLSAFRGARVQIIADRSVEGRVVGLERMPKTDAAGNHSDGWSVTIKEDGDGLAVINVDQITALHIKDRTLEVGLEKSLDISLNEGSWKPIELKVRMSDAKAKKVLVSYIVSMPVWKPAYRLVLGEEDEGLFQGWSVVDNVSGSDWNKVRMSLVAGTPMSFVYDLYSPHFVSRPDLTHRRSQVSLVPTIEESAYARNQAAPRTAAAQYDEFDDYGAALDTTTINYGLVGGSADFKRGYAEMAKMEEKKMAPPKPMDLKDYESNFETQNRGSEVSALFQYDIDVPVTVPDRSSALVNLLQSRTTAKEVFLFRPELWTDYAALEPYRAVELHNASGYDLEAGPITLLRDGTFIGEGFLPKTEKDAVTFITFAMDPRVQLKTSRSETEEAAKILKIEGGYIESEVKRVTTVEYEITNNREEKARAVIRRPIRAEWTLDPKPEGLLAAGNSNYIPFEIGPKETKTYKIKEVTPVRRTLTLDSQLSIDLLKVQISEDALDAEIKAQLQTVIDKQTELYEVREELSSLREQKRELENESWRITSSLEDIKDIKEASAKALRKQLISRAAEIEKASGEKATRIAELTLQESDLERTLRALFRSITFVSEAPQAPK